MEASLPSTIDLEDLGFDRGAHLLVDRALAGLTPGDRLVVCGGDPHLAVHLGAWARSRGHRSEGLTIVKGSAAAARWHDGTRAGRAEGPVADRAEASWGLAARGALVEAGGPTLVHADLADKPTVWADVAPKLYAQAAASQWDPVIAIDWSAPVEHPPEIEAAVVQLMTYLVENEQAALMVPARFLARIHPHYREVVQLLAIQAADEARHIEVFTRRALLGGGPLGMSGAGGRASLQTLLEEPDFSVATFLLSVLGEGTFLSLLSFIERHAPDPVTARVAHLALQDEARHVAFGLAHLEAGVARDPSLRGRLRATVERRHDALVATSGLNAEVFDALIVMAAGQWSTAGVRLGWQKVQDLQADMDQGRQRRLVRLGFPADEAAALSALHTRNFM